ncbi:MAG: hypothetical protein HRT57_08950, partial [Crocinitomicaceae bacterium]|nr:hypothetical protein [Crocinitomicaceae bacterium]
FEMTRKMMGEGDKTDYGGHTLISDENGHKVDNAAVHGKPSGEVDADLVGASKGGSRVGSRPKFDLSDPKDIVKMYQKTNKALDAYGVNSVPSINEIIDDLFDIGPPGNETTTETQRNNSISGSAQKAVKQKPVIHSRGPNWMREKDNSSTYSKGGYNYSKIKYSGDSFYTYEKAKPGVEGEDDPIVTASSASEFNAAKTYEEKNN